jgi:glycosyltransferase involved in cell wall biosynthesis
MFYFRLLFHLVNDVINYSDYERDHLSELFQGCRARFSSIHYGIGDHETTRKHADEMRLSTHLKPRKEELGLLSAGRSCRDYATLFESMRALQTPIDCTVICDSYTELPVTLWNPAIVVLRSCYGQEYTRCIIESDVVVVPLRDSMVSAGQMVALHALAAGKPVIISDTPITREYFGNCGSVHFVKLADSNSLTKSICMLEKQLLFKEQFFEQSRSFFEANFAINRFAFRLFNSIVESM